MKRVIVMDALTIWFRYGSLVWVRKFHKTVRLLFETSNVLPMNENEDENYISHYNVDVGLRFKS